MPQHYLGIDVGTTAVKALVVNESGSVIGDAEAQQALSVPQPGWSEQNPSDWWQGTIDAVRAACAQAGVKDVASIGLSGQMHSSVLLSASDEVLRPAILWNDVRTTAQCRFITEKLGESGLARFVGNPALEGFTAPKLVWVRDEEPNIFEKVRSSPTAQGLYSIPDDWREGDGSFRCRGHVALRHSTKLLVCRNAIRVGPRRGVAAADRRFRGSRRPHSHQARLRHWVCERAHP